MPDQFRTIAHISPNQGLYNDPVGFKVGPVEAIHKWNSEYRKYCIANESICNDLASFLGLPIPPYAITFSEVDDRLLFSSIKFSFEGRDDRPVMGEEVARKMPKLAAGILLFDVFVANNDRHDTNLKTDRMNDPKALMIYDHDCALFGTEGTSRFEAIQDHLAVTGDDICEGNRHCLIDHFESNKFFRSWCNQIWNIPADYIKRVCEKQMRFGLTRSECDSATEFLTTRKNKIKSLIETNAHEFCSIAKWRSI